MSLEQTISFSKITTKEQLLSYLKKKGKGHNSFYQYTKMKTLEGLLKSEKLYLSRADTLNDALEGGNIEEKKNIFISSFTSSHLESIAMWSMYSFPYYEGIRLKFERSKMHAVLSKFKEEPLVYLPDESAPLKYLGKAELSLMDVVYLNNSRLEHYNGKREMEINPCRDLIDSITHPKIAQNNIINWCIKNATWASEIETRLILEFEQPIEHKSLAIGFQEPLLSMEIICSPCVNIQKTQNRFKEQTGITFNSSKYYDKTFFRPCSADECDKNVTSFCRKHKHQ